jgi:hypothetical protein
MFNPDTASYFKYFLQPFEAAALSLAVQPDDPANAYRAR